MGDTVSGCGARWISITATGPQGECPCPEIKKIASPTLQSNERVASFFIIIRNIRRNSAFAQRCGGWPLPPTPQNSHRLSHHQCSASNGVGLRAPGKETNGCSRPLQINGTSPI